MEQRIVLRDLDDATKTFLALPNGVAKNIIYKDKMMNHHVNSVSVLLKDDKLHYSDIVYKISCVNNKYFLKVHVKHGFTYEKGKLKAWFGSNIKKMNFVPFIEEYLKLNWIDKHDYGIITATLLGKIIAGKITNKRDLYEAWFKANRIKCTVGEYMNARRKIMDEYDLNNNRYYPFLFMRGGGQFTYMMYRLNQTMTSLDHFFKNISNIIKYYSIFFDCIDQAILLEQKINPLWSEKRIDEEHTRMTRELMEHQLNTVENKPVMYKPAVDKILNLMNAKGVEFLDNQRRVFLEGKVMDHCIYTNYWNRIENGNMYAFNFRYGDESGTLTFYPILARTSDNKDYTITCKFNEYLGKRNQKLSDKATESAKMFVEKFNMILNHHDDLRNQLAQAHLVKITQPSVIEEEYLPF